MKIKKTAGHPFFGRRSVIVLVLLLQVCLTVGQSHVRDSLLALIPVTKGSGKVDALNALGKYYWERKSDTAIQLAGESLRLSQQLNYQKGEAEANRVIGVAFVYSGNARAGAHLHTARLQFDAMHDSRGLANVCNNLGLMFMFISDLDSSIYMFSQALTLFRELKDQAGIGATLNYIGIDYQYRGEFQKAVEYAIEGLRVRRETTDYRGTMYSIINVGNMYLEAGQYEQARAYYLESIDFAKQHGLPVEYSSYVDLADLSVRTGNYKEAENWLKQSPRGYDLVSAQLFYHTGQADSATVYFEKALVTAPHVQVKYVRANALNGLARIWLEKKKYPEAFLRANQGFQLADSLHNRKLKSESAGLLSRLYELKGAYEEALHFEKISRTLNDSITGTDFKNRLAFFESRANIEKEQAQVKVLSAEKELADQRTASQRRTKLMILWISLAALAAAALVIVNINRQKRRIESQSLIIDEQRKEVQATLEDLRTTQTQLIQKEKMASLGELTAGIAHEIQNPLNFVNNFSDLNSDLLKEMQVAINAGNKAEAIQLSADLEQNMEKINQHGRRADAIVKNMLQHSTARSGQMELTDLNEMAEEMLRVAYHGFKANGKNRLPNKEEFNVVMDTQFDNNLSRVQILPQEFGRVLFNIYNNALDALFQAASSNRLDFQPRITVRTGKNSRGQTQISIRDNGGGIAANIRDKIFQPFFTTKPTGQGTGLGLSLSYDIVTKAHNGRLELVNTEGKGAEFIISLP